MAGGATAQMVYAAANGQELTTFMSDDCSSVKRKTTTWVDGVKVGEESVTDAGDDHHNVLLPYSLLDGTPLIAATLPPNFNDATVEVTV